MAMHRLGECAEGVRRAEGTDCASRLSSLELGVEGRRRSSRVLGVPLLALELQLRLVELGVCELNHIACECAAAACLAAAASSARTPCPSRNYSAISRSASITQQQRSLVGTPLDRDATSEPLPAPACWEEKRTALTGLNFGS